MSFIIEQLSNPLFSHSNPYYQPYLTSKIEVEPTPTFLQKQKENLVKSLGSLSNCVVSSVVEGKEIILNILANHIFRNVPVIFKIRLNGKTKQLKISFNLINNDNKFIILNSKQRRILFCKILGSRYYLTSFQQFKMAVKIETGQIQFFSPIFYLKNSTPQPISKIAHQIFKHFLSNIKILNPSINLLKQICNEACSQFHHEFTRRAQNQKLSRIYYYSHITNVNVNLTLDSTNQESSINLKQQKEIRSLKELKNNYLSLKNKNGLQLFAMLSAGKEMEEQIKKYQIDYFERENIGEKTELPPMQRAKIPENNFILNFIKLSKDFSQLSLTQLNSGGFARIYVTQVQYWYVGSYSTTTNLQSFNPPLKKYIVVKKAKPEQQDSRNRIAHEKAIINKIKHGLSLFLPKYYINSEKDDDNEILSDFINFPTLSDYISRNKQTMSYHTKIFFGYIIAQALRYLQEYNIVHLDLKPPNIMLYKNMMVKLIDFGESYHPDVKSNGYRPGFSIPYSAPENYHKSDFTYKNDVFSLGIILYELFFSKLPFFIHDKQNKQKMDHVYLNNESVSKYWYCSPEENMNFGESQIFPIIQLLICKCISHEPKERPELQWIAYILRNCLDYLCNP